MKTILPKVIDPFSDESSPRFEIQQALLDDSKDESMAMGTILHRCNYLYSMISQRNRERDKKSQTFVSLSISITREVNHILMLIGAFYQIKTKHFENQHAILSKLMKSLKKYR